MFQKFWWGRFHILPGWCYSILRNLFSLLSPSAIYSVHHRHSNLCLFLYNQLLQSCWGFSLPPQLPFLLHVPPCFSPYSLQSDQHFVSQNGHRALNAKCSKNLTENAFKAFLAFTGSIIVFALPKRVMLLSHAKFKNGFSARSFASELSSICKFPNPYLCTSYYHWNAVSCTYCIIFLFLQLKICVNFDTLMLTNTITCWSGFSKTIYTSSLQWSGCIYRWRTHIFWLCSWWGTAVVPLSWQSRWLLHKVGLPHLGYYHTFSQPNLSGPLM